MNRAERKRQEREIAKQKNVYVFNEHDYRKKLATMKEDLKIDIVQQLWGVMLVSLRDEFGWFSNKNYGTKRINRFIDRFNENMGHIGEGNVALQDFNEWCQEEGIGYEVRKMRGRE